LTEVTIRNRGLLHTLDSFVDMFYSIPEDIRCSKEHQTLSSQQAADDPEYFCGEEYLISQKALGSRHSGYPEEYYSHPVTHMVKSNPEIFTEFKDRVKHQFASEIGAHTSALLNYYPPGGFVGWHTNWNAHCYQILFTWSKDGNGYFRYWDNQKQEIVHTQDVPGWQCRHYYFGRLDEPEHHCWHAAYAGSDRITLAYKFVNNSKSHPSDAMAQAMRDDLISEIESK